MSKFITEDDIEQAILDKLKSKEFNYDVIVCDIDPEKREDLKLIIAAVKRRFA